MSFGNRKIDLWVAFAPDPELAKKYDIQREASAREVNARIVETGSYRSHKTPARPAREVKFEAMVNSLGPSVKRYATDNPTASLSGMAARFGLTPPRVKQLLVYYGLPARDKPSRGV